MGISRHESIEERRAERLRSHRRCLWSRRLQNACASCGCTLTADWLSQGLAAQPGTTLMLRYDYIPQATLRTGTEKVDRGAIALPTDRELERYTYNHSLTVDARSSIRERLGP